MIDIQKLKALAEDAGPNDPWYESGDLRYADDKTGEIHGLDHQADEFIAAANPATVIELIAERNVYRAVLEGAGYSQIDNVVELGPDFARRIGSAAASLTICIQQERDRLIAEIERLQRFETAYKEFSDKTDWVRPNAAAHELGMHVADVIRKRCDDLTSHNQAQAEEILRLRAGQTDWQAECLKRGFEYVRESDDHYVEADVPEMADLLGALLGVEVRSKDNHSYEEANSRLNDQIEGLINTIHSLESMRKDAERWRFVRNPIGTCSPLAVWREGRMPLFCALADIAVDDVMAQEQQS